jgi:hypothetical protein
MTDTYEVNIKEIRPPDPAIYDLTVEEVEDAALPDTPDDQDRLMEELAASVQSLVGDAAVRIARGQNGVAESGGEDCGTPHTRYVRYFGASLPPLPWCAFFVSWSFAQAGERPPWRNPGYVGSVYEWAKSNGRLVTTPAHGDMFGLGNHHMGLVAGANPGARQIYTVEGNYSDRVGSRLMNYASEGAWFARL